MSDLIKMILAMSLSGSLMILILVALRPIVKKAFSSTWQYYVWVLVLIRLLVPFSPDFGLLNVLFQNTHAVSVNRTAKQDHTTLDLTDVSQENNRINKIQGNGKNELVNDVAESNKTVDNEIVNNDIISNEFENKTSYNSGINVANSSTTNSSNAYLILEKLNQSHDVWVIICFVWMLGMAIMLLRKITQYGLFQRAVSRDHEPVADQNCLNIYKQVAQELHIKKIPRIYVSGRIQSPMLIGLIKPSIYLTENALRMDANSLSYVLRHELIHYKRFDYVYKWICETTRVIHWFNPLVYLMSMQINKQCEIACDEAVARDLECNEKLLYSNVLLQAAAEHTKYRKSVLSTTLYEDKKSLKERLSFILHAKRKSKRNKILSAIYVVILCVAAIYLGTYSKIGKAANTKVSDNKTVHNQIAADNLIAADNKLVEQTVAKEKQKTVTSTDEEKEDNDAISDLISSVLGDDNDSDGSSSDEFYDVLSNDNVFHRKSESRKEERVINNVNLSKVAVNIGCGNITIGYHKEDSVQINIKYDANGESKDRLQEILANSKLHAEIVAGTLNITVNKINTNRNMWKYMEENYKHQSYFLGVDMTILLPESVKDFDVTTDLGDIKLNSLSGQIAAYSDMGAIHADNVVFEGESKLTTDMGTIDCELNEDQIAKSNVTLDSDMGEIRINLNGHSYSQVDRNNHDHVSDSMKLLIGKKCNMKANTSLGVIKLKK